MNRLSKGILFGFCAQVFVASAMTWGNSSASAGAAPKKPRPTIVAAVPRWWPPQYSTDENGKPTGFAIDVMAEIARRAGVKVQYLVLDTFSDVSETMRKGKAQIVPNSGITADRASGFFFTEPVETFVVSIFVRHETHDISGLEDLIGRKVAVVRNNVSEKLLRSRSDITAVVHRDAPTALFNLLSGHQDALVFPRPVMLSIARKAGVAHHIKAVGKPLREIKRAIRIQRSERELFVALNKAVKDFVDTPAYRRIYGKWYGAPEPFWTAAVVAWVMGGIFVIALVAMAAWRYRSVLRLNRALNESESLLNSIIENIPVGLLIKNANHVIERANGTYLDWYGFKPGTMVNHRSDEIEDFQSDEEAAFMNSQEMEVLSAGKTQTRQVERPFADGRIHTVNITKFPIYDQQGKIIKVGSASVDLSEQVHAREALARSEARFRDFAESASDWLYETDEHFRFTYFSERNFDVTGFDPAVNLGKTRDEITTEDTNDGKWRRHLDDLQNHRPFRDFRFSQTRSDGSELTVSVSGQPVFGDDGRFLGYRGTGADFTEQRRIEADRDKALQEAEQANQAKSEFLATMSHDFRTPLNAILGFSEMMRAQYFGPLGAKNYEEYANDIHESGELMLELINDILDISAIEAGKRFLTEENIEIEDLLGNCIKNVEQAANEGGIRLSLEVPEDCPPLYGDRRSVTQIALNLLSNAIKFTDRDGEIVVTATAGDQEMSIRVSDSGIGIPSDKLPNIAEPFYQTYSDPHLTQTGTGLGLSIVKSLVEAHGGELAIESEVGKGTTVTVTFPT